MANPAKTQATVQERFERIMRACLATPPEKRRKRAAKRRKVKPRA